MSIQVILCVFVIVLTTTIVASKEVPQYKSVTAKDILQVINSDTQGDPDKNPSSATMEKVQNMIPQISPYEVEIRRNKASRDLSEQRWEEKQNSFEHRCYKFIAEKELAEHHDSSGSFHSYFSDEKEDDNNDDDNESTVKISLKGRVKKFLTSSLHDWRNNEGISKEKFCKKFENQLHSQFNYTFIDPKESFGVSSCIGAKTACKCFASRHGFGIYDTELQVHYRHDMLILKDNNQVFARVSEKTYEEKLHQIDHYIFTFTMKSNQDNSKSPYKLIALEHTRVPINKN